MEFFKYRKDKNSPWVEIAALIGPMGPKPEVGVDYFTETDKQEIVNEVIAALQNGDEVSY